MKAVRAFETSVSDYPLKQHNIAEDPNTHSTLFMVLVAAAMVMILMMMVVLMVMKSVSSCRYLRL
jgi:hypothetical protein